MKMLNKKNVVFSKLHRLKMIIVGVFCIAFTVAAGYLYYHQSVQQIPLIEAGSHYFESDLPYHIWMVVANNWFYSVTGLFYKVFFMLPNSEVIVATFLALITGATVLVTYKLLFEQLKNTISKEIILLIALALNFVMAAHLDFAHTQWYIGYESGNLWHNSTYIVMRFFGLLTLLFYWRVESTYREKIIVRDLLLFTLFLSLTTATKPSFAFVMLPVMALFLLFDLAHKVPFKKVALFALSVLPSFVIIVLQNTILFGEDTGNTIVIDPWYTLSLHAAHPKLTLLLSIAFPLFVLLFSIKEVWANKRYLFAWTMWGIGFLQILLLTETGTRSNDGNFLWGYAFCIFFLFVESSSVFVKQVRLQIDNKKLTFRWVYLMFGSILFAYQLYCGVQFFLWMLQGITYWV